jgi:hypothetical protein
VPRRDWGPIAAVVAVVLLALVVVGRLQNGNLADGDAGPSQATRGTVGKDAAPVASGLAVVGRVPLPGQAAAIAVGEGAVWVLLKQGTLLRVDLGRYQVTGSVELGAPTGGMQVGPLAVGAGAVWVGTQKATVTVRVDPVSLRVTARFGGHVAMVAHGVLWFYCCPRGDKAMGFGRTDARTLRPRPPLVVKGQLGQTSAGRAARRRRRRGVDPGARGPAAMAGAAGGRSGPRCGPGVRRRVWARRGRRRGVGPVGDR